jgi:hypothetical protein
MVQHRESGTAAGAAVDFPLRLQISQHGTVAFVSPALVEDIAVPMQSVLLQRIKYQAVCAGHLTRWIDILDSQQPAASGRARVHEARNSGKQGTEMQGA